MPDLGSSGFSRVCPACGRHVPRAVGTCRCGAAVPADTGPDGFITAPATRSTSLTFVGIAVVAVAIAGAVYRSSSRPPPPLPLARGDTPAPRVQPAPNSRLPGAADESPEHRAWQASLASNVKEPAPAPAPVAAPVPAADLPTTIEDVVGRVMPAVVLIETTSGRGSGFFVRPDTLLTNVHVVQSDEFVTLRRMDGSSVPARVDTRSPAFDIAVLKVSNPAANQIVIPLGSVKTLRPGQEVITIGSALGTLQNSVTRGVVSGVRQSGNATLVQTDAAANPGNSGGPLLDRTGTAIGITTMGYRDQQGLNFAVAIDHARDILDGRQVSPPVKSNTISELRALSPAIQSETERAQENGHRAFLAAMENLSGAAGELDGAWRRFRASCYSSPIVGSFDREWFAVFSPRAMPTPVPQQCNTYLSTFKAEADRFSGLMRAALESARRTGVLPGVVRETLRSRRLQFEGWDR